MSRSGRRREVVPNTVILPPTFEDKEDDDGDTATYLRAKDVLSFGFIWFGVSVIWEAFSDNPNWWSTLFPLVVTASFYFLSDHREIKE